MTNKEAKSTIEIFYDQILRELWLTNEQRKGLSEALDLAIKALRLADCPQVRAECKACGGAFCDGEEVDT